MMDQVTNLIMSNAYADPVGLAPSPQGGSMSFIIMLVIFVVFMYFAVWRPQSKRAREQRQLLTSITKGDEVMTAGGLLGRVAKLSDQYISLAVSGNVEIMMQKTSIVSVLPKGTLKSLE